MDEADSEAIRGRLIRLLEDGRPRPIEEIASALEVSVDDIDWVFDDDRFALLPEGFVDLIPALAGRMLTHRLTEGGAEAEDLDVEPDLRAILGAFADEVPLVDGGTAWLSLARIPMGEGEEDVTFEVLSGPAGWLGGARAGDLVGLRNEDGRICVERVDADPAASERAARALGHAFEECVDPDEEAWLASTLVAAVRHDPDAFLEPVAPIAELLDLAGLVCGGGWLWRQDGHEGGDDFDRPEFLETTYGFSDCCHRALERVEEALGLRGDGVEIDVEVARALSHGSVAEAFSHENLLWPGQEPPGLDPEAAAGMARELARTATGRSCAGPHYLRGMALEALDRPLEADQAFREALEADPEHPAALEEAARYADERGDARLAASLLRQAGVGESDPALARLARFLRPAARRNEPCPCGSGRKYKVCCLPRGGHPLPNRVWWLYGKAIAFSRHPRERALLIDLATRLARDAEDPRQVIIALGAPLVVDTALFEGGGLARFLLARGTLLPDDERELAAQWLGLPRRLFEVVAWSADRSRIELRDTRSGEIEWVDAPDPEDDGRTAHLGDLLLGRLLPDGRERDLIGPVVEVPLRLRDAALEITSEAASAEDWMDFLRMARAPPVLVNAEMEAILLCTARYAVADPEAARAALTRALEPEKGGEGESEADAVFHQHVEVDGQRWLRGTVRMSAGELSVEANSEARFERLVAIVEEALGGARPLEERRLTPDQAVAERGDPEGPREPPSAEMAAWLEEHMVAYARRWVDEEIPALGGLTPRQARDDPTRREDLEALLREMERLEEESGEGELVMMPTAVIRRELDPPD